MTGNGSGIWRGIFLAAVLAGAMVSPMPAFGQLTFPSADAPPVPNPLTDPTVKPGKMLLFDLEARFAEDGVALGNGAAPLVGRVAIAKSANWDPKVYQLTWTPTDALMGPSGDIGYTWGHYEGHSKDANGKPVTTSGRYITIWRKQPDGNWKVVLDAGSNEPAAAGDCCKLPAGS